ncbi:Uncharacterised protein [Yersinia enterocolitica]|nr:Uncharacterised protein [Yersinia enterocolitica]
MFIETFGDKRCQNFIDAVNGCAAIDMAGDLRDNLRGHCGSSRNGFWRLDFRITHFKTLSQHAIEVNQHAVEHREEWRVIQIVIMNFTTFMSQDHVSWQNMLFGVVFRDNTGQQITLSRDDFAVFIRIFVQQRFVTLLYQTPDFLIQATTQFTRDIPVMAILDIGSGELLVLTSHQLVFYRSLDIADINFRLVLHRLSDRTGNSCTIIRVDHANRQGCTLDRFLDSYLIKRYLTTVPFNHYCFHNVAPVSCRVGLAPKQSYPQGKPQHIRVARGCGWFCG